MVRSIPHHSTSSLDLHELDMSYSSRNMCSSEQVELQRETQRARGENYSIATNYYSTSFVQELEQILEQLQLLEQERSSSQSKRFPA